MTHYVCVGSCAEELSQSGICESDFCSEEGKPLVPCNCEDGIHEGAGEKNTDSEDATD